MQLGITKKIEIGGKTIEIETGKLAKQADGSAVIKMGGTMLLATVVSAKKASEGIDFMPLTVEYREKFPSSGKIPGGFLKREARPSDTEILTARLVDRALRPLFPDDYHAETQMMISLISYDDENLPDALAGFAASCALAISDIPFAGPVSEVRIARIDGEFVINPTVQQLPGADMDMIIAGTADNIMMVEGEMSELSEGEMIEAIKTAHESIKIQCAIQEELASEIDKSSPKREYDHEPSDEELAEKIKILVYDKCYSVAKLGLEKEVRSEKFGEIKEELLATFSEEELEENAFLIDKYFRKAKKEAVRRLTLDESVRLDGRKLDEVRPIWSEVDYLPGTHGSAIFTRGETQSLSTITLGSKMDEQMIDGALRTGSETLLLHYNFPPFSTGEARPIRGVSRREIGHGNLALRALKPMIPTSPENPYTIRIVSDILESNGSSSMATVCAGTLALMDAGVQIKRPVSGIAMGLITDADGKYAILSDILGDEDHLGDMDFKVTGTEKGITACQMDIKVDGLSYEVLAKALDQAKAGREHILNEMLKTISTPNEDYKPHAPRIISFEIPNDMVGAVIGPGGKVIQEIQRETGAELIIDEKDNKAFVSVFTNNKQSMDDAVTRVKNIISPPVPEIGETYEGKVKSIMPYGAFVEILPGTDGLLHISEIEWRRLEKVEEVLKEGEMVKFKVVAKDPRNGKYKLSRKVILPKPEKSSV